LRGKQVIKLTVNGEPYEVEVEPHMTLLEVLRDKLNLTGTKGSCGVGECGTCTVLVDGKPFLSCLTLAITVRDKNILTIEGLARDKKLHILQKAFLEHGAVQCGFCTPAMLLTAKALLDENPNPTREEIREYISGVLCRCTGYVKIIEAIMSAAEEIRRRGSEYE